LVDPSPLTLAKVSFRDYDEYGPAGPTSFWKIRDGVEEKKPSGAHSPMTQFTVPLY